MIIKELIEQLQKFPPEMEVCTLDSDACCLYEDRFQTPELRVCTNENNQQFIVL